jgi:hypothetical protein
MFIESVQYSLQTVRVVIKNYTDEQKVLPVSTAKDKVKCLDFDMDKVVFRTAPKSPVKLAEVNPYNKSWLEVMDMV